MRLAALVLAILGAAGCSLLVSTSDLDNGQKETLPEAGAIAEAGPAAEAGALDDASATADGGSVAMAGLIGAWLFNDGTPNDSSGHGHNATLSGEGTFPTVDGRGGVLMLNGAGNLIMPALDDTAFPKSGSISLWFRWASMMVEIEDSIFDSYDPVRDHVLIRHANHASVGAMQMAFQTAQKDAYAFAIGFTANQNEWVHVVGTWDQAVGRGTLYINGALFYSDPYAFPFAPGGQHMTFGGSFHGMIDDIQLFDHALSAAEVAALR